MSESLDLIGDRPVFIEGRENYERFFCPEIEEVVFVLDVHPHETINEAIRKYLEANPFDASLPITFHSFNPEARRKDVRFIDCEPMGHALPGRADGNTEQREGARFEAEFGGRIDPDQSALVVNPHSHNFHEEYEYALVGPKAPLRTVVAASYLGLDNIVVSDLNWFGQLPGCVTTEQSEAKLHRTVNTLRKGTLKLLSASESELVSVAKDVVREASFWRIVEVMIQNGAQDNAYPFSDTALVLDVQSDAVKEFEALTDIVPFEPLELSNEAKAALGVAADQVVCGGLQPHKNLSRVDKVLGKARSGDRLPILGLRRRMPRRRCLMTFMVPIDNDEIEASSPWIHFPQAEAS